jgi:hypothetical protein
LAAVDLRPAQSPRSQSGEFAVQAKTNGIAASMVVVIK